jgi:hypothetical protein
MKDLFAVLAARSTLPPIAAGELAQRGFTVLPGPIPMEDLRDLQAAYDAACANAAPEDIRVGRTSARVTDFVNRGPAFDTLYNWPPALAACCSTIAGPFRLSAMHARTLLPGAAAQELHVDVPRTSDAWPMLGAIFMMDEFRVDNGATRFVPGSHRWMELPETTLADCFAMHPDEVLACGPAGSVLLFHASTWHGHTANVSPAPRRSLQMTFIPRDGRTATDFAARMRPETLARLGPVARYLVGLE